MKDKINIEFTAGYYEWNIYVDEKLFYTVDVDFSDSEINNINDLDSFVDDCICAIQDELKENEKPTLDANHISVLKEKMIEAWSWHLGLEESSLEDQIRFAEAKKDSCASKVNSCLVDVSRDEGVR